MNWLVRTIERWRMARELNRNLAARKTLRPQRSAAARKGWEKRRA